MRVCCLDFHDGASKSTLSAVADKLLESNVSFVVGDFGRVHWDVFKILTKMVATGGAKQEAEKKLLLQERPFLQQFTMDDSDERPFPVSAYPACVVVLALARRVTHVDEKPAWSTWGKRIKALPGVGDAVPTSFRDSMVPIGDYKHLSLGDADRGSGQQLRGFGHLKQKAADITSVPRGLLSVSVFRCLNSQIKICR